MLINAYYDYCKLSFPRSGGWEDTNCFTPCTSLVGVWALMALYSMVV